MIVGVIGAGAWGSALGLVAARGGATVLLWSFSGDVKHFDGVQMPDDVTVTTNMTDMAKCDAWLIATPSEFFANTVTAARPFYNNQPVVICTKGADYATGRFMSQILAEKISNCTDMAVLSGPQFAAELARGVPTGSTIAGTAGARAAAHDILGHAISLQDSDDIAGTEFCGTGKNAVALISGYMSIRAAGENERALVFTRAWGDVIKIGLAYGAKLETFLGLCGIGDLFLSATSETSRNFSGGIAIAKNQPPVGTVEGIGALRGLLHHADRANVDVQTLRGMAQQMGL